MIENNDRVNGLNAQSCRHNNKNSPRRIEQEILMARCRRYGLIHKISCKCYTTYTREYVYP